MAAPLPLTAPEENGVTVQPLPPDGAARGWVVVGPRTRDHLARVLEAQAAPVWVALLEMSGVPEGAPYRVVVDGAHLEPLPPGSASG